MLKGGISKIPSMAILVTSRDVEIFCVWVYISWELNVKLVLIQAVLHSSAIDSGSGEECDRETNRTQQKVFFERSRLAAP